MPSAAATNRQATSNPNDCIAIVDRVNSRQSASQRTNWTGMAIKAVRRLHSLPSQSPIPKTSHNPPQRALPTGKYHAGTGSGRRASMEYWKRACPAARQYPTPRTNTPQAAIVTARGRRCRFAIPYLPAGSRTRVHASARSPRPSRPPGGCGCFPPARATGSPGRDSPKPFRP